MLTSSRNAQWYACQIIQSLLQQQKLMNSTHLRILKKALSLGVVSVAGVGQYLFLSKNR